MSKLQCPRTTFIGIWRNIYFSPDSKTTIELSLEQLEDLGTSRFGRGDIWTTLWDKIFKLVKILVVVSHEWENVISFSWFGYFTPSTWALSLHVVLCEYLRVFLNTPFKKYTLKEVKKKHIHGFEKKKKIQNQIWFQNVIYNHFLFNKKLFGFSFKRIFIRFLKSSSLLTLLKWVKEI